jgi:hypothetical protein
LIRVIRVHPRLTDFGFWILDWKNPVHFWILDWKNPVHFWILDWKNPVAIAPGSDFCRRLDPRYPRAHFGF